MNDLFFDSLSIRLFHLTWRLYPVRMMLKYQRTTSACSEVANDTSLPDELSAYYHI